MRTCAQSNHCRQQGALIEAWQLRTCLLKGRSSNSGTCRGVYVVEILLTTSLLDLEVKAERLSTRVKLYSSRNVLLVSYSIDKVSGTGGRAAVSAAAKSGVSLAWHVHLKGRAQVVEATEDDNCRIVALSKHLR